MWWVCHRWSCSSSLSEPVLFHIIVNGRKANCIMTKDNNWKEMKDSDIAVLWFLISIPKWEGKKFLLTMATVPFIRCLWAWSLLLSPRMFYIFSSIAYGWWRTKKLRKHLWFSFLWNEATRVLAKIPASWAEDRADLAPSEEASVFWNPLLGSSLNIRSPSPAWTTEIRCPAEVCSDSLAVRFVEQLLGFVLQALNLSLVV